MPKDGGTVVIIEHMYQTSQPEDAVSGDETQNQGAENKSRQRPPIGELLRKLRGTKTLRQVEADTGITNAYLSNIELGQKKPGIKTLAKLGVYHQVPLDHLLQVAGLQDLTQAPDNQESVIDIQRAYDFVLDDPNVAPYQKPSDTPSLDVQKFVVEMYQRFTGRRLL